uniref:Transcription factor Elf N-terminal domain-containing protein n=1 Tax=Oryzias melastigma TaxID=30732 RepID=A0A3B3DER3_ORYME
MTSVVVSDGGGSIEEDEADGVVVQEDNCPAVIVEEVPSAQVEECYSAQVLVCDDGTYLMQDVAEEQEVVTEVAETGECFTCVWSPPFLQMCDLTGCHLLPPQWKCQDTTWCALTKHLRRLKLFCTWNLQEDFTMNAAQVTSSH